MISFLKLKKKNKKGVNGSAGHGAMVMVLGKISKFEEQTTQELQHKHDAGKGRL